MSEHLSFSKDEERDSFCEVVAEKNGKLPINAFTWLITPAVLVIMWSISFQKMNP